MLNLLTKTKPWIVASLLVATSVFGQDAQKQSTPKANGNACPAPVCKPKAPCPAPCPQPCPPTQMCPPPAAPACCPPWPVPVLNAAYNYPARTMTRCPWDVYFDASFIYWQPNQENMELGVYNKTASGFASGIDSRAINMTFDYKPGFKVGMGFNVDYDNWDVRAEYTWFHNTQSSSYTIPEGTSYQAYPKAGTANATAGGTHAFTSLSQKWRLNMDIVEADLGRWHYIGTKFTVRPSVGARAAFIRQKNTNVNSGDLTTSGNIQTVSQQSHSWAVGPQFALESNWLFGCGFRFFGNAEADLLYTRYTKLSTHVTNTDDAVTPVTNKQSNVGAVRTHLDVETGFGWGTYLDCNNYYVDFTAGYGFQVFFDQNMFAFSPNGTAIGKTANPNGNLYTQGLTLTARMDF